MPMTLDLSSSLKFITQIASVEAKEAKHQYIEPEHLFIGLCSIEKLLDPETQNAMKIPAVTAADLQSDRNSLSVLLGQYALDVAELRREMRGLAGFGTYKHYNAPIHRSSDSRKIFERAHQFAERANASAVGAFHLLAALIEKSDSKTARLLEGKGVSLAAFKQTVENVLNVTPPEGSPGSQQKIVATPFLDRFGKDLVKLAREGKIHDAIGEKAKEAILKIIRTLGKEVKNNPVLIGEAGVGKTAIVEGLAFRVAHAELGKVPIKMANKRIIQLSITDIIAGTQYRGEVEKRMQGIMQEAQAPEIILFIDELHTVVGAGAVSNAMGIENMLKPPLARSELRCIGATTSAEYYKHIGKDAAFERRFYPILIEEPTSEETLKILQARKERLAQWHSVDIAPDALEAAVELATRYIPDRNFPDKAIEILEEACSLVVYPTLSVYPGQEAVKATVTRDTIARVVSERIGDVPVSGYSKWDIGKLRTMAEELKKRVIGQDEACETVANALIRAYAGLKNPNTPVGVFLFSGPTGVGKTELAKATASFLFDSEKAMHRFDMSEYKEGHSISKLIGSPPGYIGHDEEAQLTGKLRRRPFSLVLLDEIDKAHADVLNLFLQIFDEGRITDSKGRTIDAKHALFILTANLPATRPVGLEVPSQDNIRANLARYLRPELVNRFDAIVSFSSLNENNLRAIASRLVAEVGERLKPQKIELNIKSAVLTHLCQKVNVQQFGARPLCQLIDNEIANMLSRLMVNGKLQPGDKIAVTVENNVIVHKIERDQSSTSAET